MLIGILYRKESRGEQSVQEMIKLYSILKKIRRENVDWTKVTQEYGTDFYSANNIIILPLV
jgi:adenosine deaminase